MKRHYAYSRRVLDKAPPRPILIPDELDGAGLRPATFRLLCHLVRHGACQTSGAWRSVNNMAVHCGIDPKRVKLGLRQLIEAGWMTRISRPGYASIYYVTIPQTSKRWWS